MNSGVEWSGQPAHAVRASIEEKVAVDLNNILSQ